MNYYNEIKNRLIDNEIYEKIKDYSKERNRVTTYYEIGKLLRLVIEVGKKYNKKLLFKMIQLYFLLHNKKVAPMVRQLSWSHCLIFLPIKNINEVNYYINQTCKRNVSKRELQNLVKSNEYERLKEDTKNKLSNKEEILVSDFIKNPIFIKNIYNYKEISERILKQLILEDMDSFLTELGNGFCYMKNEYKIKLGDRYNYIDLLLYNIKYRCYTAVELKITELKS